jgi:hypothetical protein
MLESKRKVVEAFMHLVEQDMRDGVLPVKSLKHAKTYIEGMIGKKI